MSFKTFQSNLSHLRPWLTLFAIIWLLGTFGLGWLVNSLLIILGLLFFAPILAFVGFRWWLQRSLVADNCPVCQYQFTGFSGSQSQCPSCGEIIEIKDGKFNRYTPPGTIDVDAIDVSVQKLD